MSMLDGARILIVGINYSPESTGIAPYTTATAQALTSAGAEVTVVTGIPHYPRWKVSDPRYLAHRTMLEHIDGVRVLRVRHHVPSTPHLLGRARMELSFFLGAVRAIRSCSTSFDAVIAVTPSISGAAAALVAPARRGRGVVVQDLTGVGAAESGAAGATVARLIARAEQRVLKSYDLVGVIAPRFGDVLSSSELPLDRIVQVPNFTHITPNPISRTEARVALGWPTDAFTVVHTGNMGMKQGLESVIDAARDAHHRGVPVRFVLVGDGNQGPQLAQLAAGIPTSHLELVPPLSEDRYPLALAASDALLLNERAGVREMCLPSKLTSYVAASRPIVAAVEVDGISGRTLSGARAAAICSPSDPGALLDTVRALVMNTARQDELTTNAAHYGAAHYSAHSATLRYQAFAERLLDDRPDAMDENDG
ncbi:glycosyltransferase family 4 protein [Cellulomonas sp. PhB143]|uniref:glycosyltransferase family 4 protein n=1 Tax=Cellulomonas sp. PhB143 TaxID=2485186 RepID=UPI000F48E589|nr:glycosyltransferase family 4 protein [Cellulomonas sp. PhB143]ROS78674.1 glycosyltransferase involved in cell wall biosynthesis [Cellulomonas sp. PhB143]